MTKSKIKEEIERQIGSVSRRRKQIIPSYPFGSFVLGTTNKDSDVDAQPSI